MIRIGIVTVNYNSAQETHDFLTSLRKMDMAGLETHIFVVDNASSTPFVLSPEEEKQKITVFQTEKNLGFTGGYNTGIQKALLWGAEYVFVVNNDTLLDPLIIQELLKPFIHNANVGVTVPKIYFAKGYEYHKQKYTTKDLGHVIWYAGGYVDWKNVFSKHIGLDEVDRGQYDQEKEVMFATGCCVLFSADMLQKIGLFDDKFFLYFEDADLSMRIARAGYTIVYVPTALVNHKNAASSGSGSALHDYYLTRNRMLFGMKYAPLRTKVSLIRESIRLLFSGRHWQKKGIFDFYLRKFGEGSFEK